MGLAERLDPDFGTNAAYEQFKRTYENDPVAFVHDCFVWRVGESPAFYQDEVLGALPIHKRVCARGPHGLGKTALNSWAVIWFSLTRDGARVEDDGDWKCLTTAGVWRQLEKYLWPEIRKWRSRLRWDVIGRDPFAAKTEAFLMSMRLKTGEAFPVASDNHELIEGAHADRIMYIFDESKAISGATFDAAEGAFSGAGSDTDREALALACSTPGEPVGRFYNIQSRKPGFEDWHVVRITREDAIKAGRISTEWADQRKRQWGATSAMYKNRVMGEFAATEQDSVIPLTWVEQAVDRWKEWKDASASSATDSGTALGYLTSVGCDVGRGGDPSMIADCYDYRKIETLESIPDADTMKVVGRLGMRRLVRDGAVPVIIDVVGVGGGPVDRCRELEYQTLAFNAGRATKAKDKSDELLFADLRSAAWWWLREMLDPQYEENVCLPDDDELIAELTAPKWAAQSGGRIKVESKDSLRQEKRLGRSTDRADAVIQALVGVDLMAVDDVAEPQISVGGF